MSLTGNLIAEIRKKPVTNADLEAAALHTLDTVACIIGGLKTDTGRILVQHATDQGVDPGRRAFLLGGLAHIIEIDDLHRESVTHPGCVVIPAAWALAEKIKTNGRLFLEAVLYGYEACTRVGMAVGKQHYNVWHNTATCGPFGSAMAVAHLLKLSDEQALWALCKGCRNQT